jgi:hypothetical protein
MRKVRLIVVLVTVQCLSLLLFIYLAPSYRTPIEIHSILDSNNGQNLLERSPVNTLSDFGIILETRSSENNCIPAGSHRWSTEILYQDMFFSKYYAKLRKHWAIQMKEPSKCVGNFEKVELCNRL